jgi:hypothetical protein
MEHDPVMKQIILEAVATQIRTNNPPATKQTYERLLKEGQSASEAKRLIGCVLAVEMLDIMKEQKPFNKKRFAAGLNKLPKLPE